MKKVIVFVLVSILLLNVFPSNLVMAEEKYATVDIDGKSQRVREIDVTVNGQALDSDVPPILYEDRTLVPIRYIANHLKADIKWVQETKEVIINSGGKEIVLKIDSSDVIIDGEVKTLPYNVPAKLVNNGRTFVPLRFVSEELDCNVDWDHSTYTAIITYKDQQVKDILVDDNLNTPKVIIETTGIVDYDIIKLKDNTKIVIDIPNTLLKLDDLSKYGSNGIVDMDVDKYPVKNVKSSQFQYDPDTTRVVINLDEEVEYQIRYLKDRYGLEISFINRTKDITLNESDGEKEIIIENTKVPEYNMFTLDEPKRVVLDLLNTYYEKDDIYKYEIETDVIKDIRAAQFDPEGHYSNTEDVLRVVFDIKEDVNIYSIMPSMEDNNLKFKFKRGVIEGINYVVNSESKESFINVKDISDDEFDLSYDKASNVMEIKLPKEKAPFNNGIVVDKNYYIDTIEVFEDDDSKIIKISFNDNITYETIVSKLGLTIKTAPIESKFSDKLIVIDPGHGGSDPGTMGPITKVKEKDLNLKVALRLKDELEKLGFKTFLTRDTDEYVGLYDRSDMANALDADAFVSIHFNANNKESISGIQTLYCPSYESDVKSGDNYPFAETIHNEVLKSTGRKDMGIKRRPELVVIRETAMVAVLMELGFVTNKDEEALLVTDEYQQKAVEGIANGLVKYFDK